MTGNVKLTVDIKMVPHLSFIFMASSFAGSMSMNQLGFFDKASVLCMLTLEQRAPELTPWYPLSASPSTGECAVWSIFTVRLILYFIGHTIIFLEVHAFIYECQ